MEDRVAKNSDELLRMIEQDEAEDGLVTQTHMAISEYARARFITPQLVHYYIRNRKLKKTRCVCGRFVINIAEADIALKFKKDGDDETDGSD